MDVVKTNIEKLRGEVTISSEKDRGTKITLSIPLTLVIVDGLLVTVGGVDYVLPLSQVSECLEDRSETPGGSPKPVIHLRNRTIPVMDLRSVLHAPVDSREETRLVLINLDGTEMALRVDGVVGKQQVVIKPFTLDLKKIPAVSGATILGDGSVALIINTNELLKISRTM